MTTAQDVTCRQAGAQDAAAIKSLLHAIMTEFELLDAHADPFGDIDDLKRFYLQNNGMFDVLVDNTGDIVGTVGFNRVDDHVCQLRKMMILPPFRGLGLGKALLNRAMNEAIAKGYREMILETARRFHKAIAMYEAAGFTPFERDDLDSGCDLWMKRKLK